MDPITLKISLAPTACGLLNSKNFFGHRRSRHISLICDRKSIISWGVNSGKTHPRSKQIGYRNNVRHSELDAVINLKRKNTDGLVLINYRFNSQGYERPSKPCSLCMSWCMSLFEYVVYLDTDYSNCAYCVKKGEY